MLQEGFAFLLHPLAVCDVADDVHDGNGFVAASKGANPRGVVRRAAARAGAADLVGDHLSGPADLLDGFHGRLNMLGQRVASDAPADDLFRGQALNRAVDEPDGAVPVRHHDDARCVPDQGAPSLFAFLEFRLRSLPVGLGCLELSVPPAQFLELLDELESCLALHCHVICLPYPGGP